MHNSTQLLKSLIVSLHVLDSSDVSFWLRSRPNKRNSYKIEQAHIENAISCGTECQVRHF